MHRKSFSNILSIPKNYYENSVIKQKSKNSNSMINEPLKINITSNKTFKVPVLKTVISKKLDDNKKLSKFSTNETLTNNLDDSIEDMHIALVAQYQRIQKLLKRVDGINISNNNA